jgi:hypothetical protein
MELVEPFLSPQAAVVRRFFRRPPRSRVVEKVTVPIAVLFWVLVILQVIGPAWFDPLKAIAWTFLMGYVAATVFAGRVSQRELDAEYQGYLATFDAEQLRAAVDASDLLYDAQFIRAVDKQLAGR